MFLIMVTFVCYSQELGLVKDWSSYSIKDITFAEAQDESWERARTIEDRFAVKGKCKLIESTVKQIAK